MLNCSQSECELELRVCSYLQRGLVFAALLIPQRELAEGERHEAALALAQVCAELHREHRQLELHCATRNVVKPMLLNQIVVRNSSYLRPSH